MSCCSAFIDQGGANCCFFFFIIIFSKPQNEGTQPTEADEELGSSGTQEELLSVDDEVPGSPPRKRRAVSLLASLLGDAFTANEPAVQTKTAFARAQEEMDMYCRAPSLPLTSEKKDEPPETPMDWWHRHEGAYPLLSRLSKRYLCIPGTSVAAERVFSTAGDVVTAKRSTLTPEHVDQLVFLHKNLEIEQ